MTSTRTYLTAVFIGIWAPLGLVPLSMWMDHSKLPQSDILFIHLLGGFIFFLGPTGLLLFRRRGPHGRRPRTVVTPQPDDWVPILILFATAAMFGIPWSIFLQGKI